ncbi:ATP-binding protein [Pseudonocardia bannensis]|uniref:ATP-binding protein n=1 Tax=Pseudonocardia bannensis TaxID=630973 RepID=A0A848DG95_9PSEU|nr:ATP-binding protein [Pseudonocardia bannensis]NMH91678.1 ATP-binding protein [Pseudonocardia bannensis]
MRDTRNHQTEFVRLTWPATPDRLASIRQRLRECLEPLGLGDLEDDLLLAVSEAATNAVAHAYDADEAGTVEVTLWTEPDALWMEVTDFGRWRAPGSPSAGGGRGILLMHRLVDGVLIRHDRRGTQVLFRQPMAGTGRAGGEELASAVPQCR